MKPLTKSDPYYRPWSILAQNDSTAICVDSRGWTVFGEHGPNPADAQFIVECVNGSWRRERQVKHYLPCPYKR